MNEELKPPEPTFTVDGKEVSYKRGTYSWSNDNKAVNADSPTPSNLVVDLENNEVSPNAELVITFDYQPSKKEGGIWEDNNGEYTSNK
ncbi:hypothetical protein [Aquibacillus sediminis]|uniref:hypothetical protein n=1 Tax=Aquibacillus sediminis TaxID=2574734 RepID=UPI0011086C7E|nr:hypothetical protein [Aquibacillus sediminis]